MLDNRIIFKLPLGVQTYINTHSSSSLPCAPKTRKARRSRNTSRCSAPGSNSSSTAALRTPSISTNRTELTYTQKKPSAVIHSEHMNANPLGCRLQRRRATFSRPAYHMVLLRCHLRYVESQGVGISTQFCRLNHQYLLTEQWQMGFRRAEL